MIPLANLKPLHWYVGRGRTCNVAFWSGRYFYTIDYSPRLDTVPRIKIEEYWDETGGTFKPMRLLEEIWSYPRSTEDTHNGQ